MPVKIELDDEQLQELWKTFEEDNFFDRGHRAEFDERTVRIYNAYRNRVKEKLFPWKGCSNTSVPLVTRATDRMVIHIMQTVAPQGTFSNMAAQSVSSSPLSDDRAADVTDYVGYYFRNRMNILDQLERYFRNFVLYGNGFGKEWWRREERMRREIHRFPLFQEIVDPETEEPVQRKTKIRDQITQHFANFELVHDLKSVGKGSMGEKFEITIYDAIDKREKLFEIEGYEEEGRRENVFLFESRETVINRPQFDNIEIGDIEFTMNSPSIQEAKRVAVHYEKSWDWIQQGWRQGKWNQLTEEDMDELEKEADIDEDIGDAPMEVLAIRPMLNTEEKLKRQQDVTEGADTFRRFPFDVWEEFRRIDLDGDGIDEDVVVWYEARTQKVLRVEHQFVDYHMHDRPIVHSGLIPIGNRILHIGIGEVLFPLLTELNSVFNMRNDAATMAVSPGGFYRPGSGFDPGPLSWAPNTWLPVDNPQADVREYVGVANSRDATNVEQFLLALAEDLSVSTQTLGRGPDRPNAPRTARGTLALLQQDSIKLDYLLLRLKPVLEQICHKTVSLLRINGPETEEFRAMGTGAMKTIRKEDLDMKYDFYWDLESVSNNKEIRRQFAATAFEALLPIANQPPEAITPGARELARRFGEMLEIKNMDQIIPDPQGFDRLPMSQQDENAEMLKGIPVRPLMSDNHQEHVQAMDELEASEGFLDSITPEWIQSVWAPHKQAHLEMHRVIQAQVQAQGGQGRTAGQGNQGNFVGDQGLFGAPTGGGFSETAAEGVGSSFTGGG
jgi:hypothetical protein